ncbi:hypothetical protein F2P79_024817 [Pimephales promelas]|nr:hypothetical protein F2P79_024817 [Pimephales promelas]
MSTNDGGGVREPMSSRDVSTHDGGGVSEPICIRGACPLMMGEEGLYSVLAPLPNCDGQHRDQKIQIRLQVVDLSSVRAAFIFQWNRTRAHLTVDPRLILFGGTRSFTLLVYISTFVACFVSIHIADHQRPVRKETGGDASTDWALLEEKRFQIRSILGRLIAVDSN